MVTRYKSKKQKTFALEMQYPDTQKGWREYLAGVWDFSEEQIRECELIQSKPQFDSWCQGLNGRFLDFSPKR